jgi:hypothetical protein
MKSLWIFMEDYVVGCLMKVIKKLNLMIVRNIFNAKRRV